MSPFFSIIIPVYNVAPYLRECLDSVLAQTFTDWEAICVDDGSTDGSGSILDEYAAKDNRVVVLHVPNGGVSRARNSALAIANGEFIGFLDGDDLLAKDWLLRAAEMLGKDSADWGRLGFTRFEGDRLPKVEHESKWTRFDNSLHWGWSALANAGFICLNFISNRVIKSKGLRFPPEIAIKEDAIFCLHAIGHCNGACQGEYAGYYYRTRMTSAGHAVRRVTDCLRFQRALVKELEADMTQAPDLLKNRAVAQSVACALWDDFTQWLINGKKGFVSYEKGLFKHMRMSFNKGYIDISTHTMGMIWLLPCLLFKAYGFVYALKCVAWLVRVRGATSRFLKRKVFHVNQ